MLSGSCDAFDLTKNQNLPNAFEKKAKEDDSNNEKAIYKPAEATRSVDLNYIKNVDSIGKYVCELCSEIHQDFGSHLCFSHGMVKCRKDRNCKLYFGSSEAREAHEILNHVSSKSSWKTTCGKCNDTFSDQYKLAYHRYTKHKMFTCSLCPTVTSAENLFKSHLGSHKFNNNPLNWGFLNFISLPIAALSKDQSCVQCNICTSEKVFLSIKEGGELFLQHFQMEHNVAKSSDILLHFEMEQTLSKTADVLLRLFDGQQISYKNLEQTGVSSSKKKASSSLDSSSNKRIKNDQVFQNVVKEANYPMDGDLSVKTRPLNTEKIMIENVEMEIKSEESMDWFASFIPSNGTEAEEDDISQESAWDEKIGSTITSYLDYKPIKIKEEKQPIKIKEEKQPIKIKEEKQPIKIKEEKQPIKIKEEKQFSKIKIKEEKQFSKIKIKEEKQFSKKSDVLIQENPMEINEVTIKAEPTGNLTWATIIPLIGGSAIGCSQSAGNLPAFHLSYTPFSNNEAHLDRYWPEVPKYHLDKDPTMAFQGIDYVNSVCPCAGLSMLNTGRCKEGGVARGSDNQHNKWMFDTSEYVLDKVKPKVLWGENAPGLFNSMGEGVVEGLIEVGKKYGYSFSIVKTNSELHGLPQKRIRTFYFFWNTPTVPKLNWKKRQSKSLLEFLNEIPKDASLQDMFMNEGKASERFRPYQFVLEREGLTHEQFYKRQKIGTISKFLEKNNLEQECIDWLRQNYPNEKFGQGTGSRRTHIQYIEHCINKKSIGKGYWDDSPRFFDKTFGTLMSKTMYTAVHPTEDRYLNVREMMHLMGLPHDFEIDKPQNINHIAQNVPVNTAKDWADEVKLFCEGKLPLTDYTFLKQDNMTQTIASGIKLVQDLKKTSFTNSTSQNGKGIKSEKPTGYVSRGRGRPKSKS